MAQVSLFAGVLSIVMAATIIYHYTLYPDGWIATYWRQFNLVFSFSSMIAVYGVFQFASGRIYAGVIANANTIAVRRGRAPFVWLKRRDCVACGKDGLSLIFNDESEYRLFDENSISTLDPRLFLERLYETWWPGTTLKSIVRHQVRAPQPWYWYLIKWSAILLPLLAVANAVVLVGARPVSLLIISALMLIPTVLLASAMHFGRSGKFRCPLPPPDAVPADIPEGVYAED